MRWNITDNVYMRLSLGRALVPRSDHVTRLLTIFQRMVDNPNPRGNDRGMTDEERIYQSIEQAIGEHRLTPGTRLREKHLAEIYGVKRGTIRKVLSRLTHSKIVEHLPNIGARVARPDLKTGSDLFATRQVLERAVIKQLCEHITGQQLKQLEDYLEQEEHAYRHGDNHQGVRLSAGFHKLLAQIAGNRVTEEFLDEIINRSPLILIARLGQHPPNGCVNQEHRQLVKALAAKDCAEAMQIMEQHLSHLQNLFNTEATEPSTDLATILRT